MPESLIDIAGLHLSAEAFLLAVLDATEQPIWVVDGDGVIRFANPAAIATLGYARPEDLAGRHSHETIHHRRPDGSPLPASECEMLRPLGTGEPVACELDWFVRRDGSMFAVSYTSVPIPMDEGRGVIVVFDDIDDRLRAEQARREHEARLAAQQASLRRVATLVAGGAASAEVLAAVAREVAHVIGLPLVAVWRYEADGTARVLGVWGERAHPFEVGTRWPLDGPTICAQVRETGRPARIDDFAELPGTIADAARGAGISACAGAPIILDGAVWGAMSTDAIDGTPLPDDVEDRLVEFTELIAATFSTTARQEELERLAAEQAALRRVATLVARGSPAAEIFGAVAEEVGRLLRVDDTRLVRYADDGTVTVVASWGALGEQIPVGTTMRLEGTNIAALVRETGRSARMDDYAGAGGAVGERMRAHGIRSAIGTPILVEGGVWGALIIATLQDEPLPAGSEPRVGEFTALIATAIANTQAKAELQASRARVVAAGDEERRRVVRDLHDGAQQRLVHTVITLKLAKRALPHDHEKAGALVDEALAHAERATAEVRELAHGILPAVLLRGGLPAGVGALAARMPVPVETHVAAGRMAPAVEATAYYVVAEALTNIAKHARATRAAVTARIADGTLQVAVRDDGIGGARPDGSGLMGLGDRLAVLDGSLRVESLPGEGTLVAATIPLPGR
jgi:PAS domain S-box-containing protein